MTALDDAERLLVSGSFERAKGEAAAARKDARSTSERVAAECVWIQAEYKLGGLTRHDLDAARMVTGFGEEFHRASVLLWSKLRLADPIEPAEAEAAAEKALTRIFERTLADRRKPKEDGDKDAEIVPSAAWLYAVHLTSQRWGRVQDARAWLMSRVNEGTLPADAWRTLDAEVEASTTTSASTNRGAPDGEIQPVDDDEDVPEVKPPRRPKPWEDRRPERTGGNVGNGHSSAAAAGSSGADANADSDSFGVTSMVRSAARQLGVAEADVRGISPAVAGAVVVTAGVVAFSMVSEVRRAWGGRSRRR
jgi:hypothetical protein